MLLCMTVSHSSKSYTQFHCLWGKCLGAYHLPILAQSKDQCHAIAIRLFKKNFKTESRYISRYIFPRLRCPCLNCKRSLSCSSRFSSTCTALNVELLFLLGMLYFRSFVRTIVRTFIRPPVILPARSFVRSFFLFTIHNNLLSCWNKTRIFFKQSSIYSKSLLASVREIFIHTLQFVVFCGRSACTRIEW